MKQVHVIRHGRPAGAWGDGDWDPGLHPDGQAQAEAAAREILALPESAWPSRVISSPLRRCRETAMPLARALGVEVEIDPRVGEIPTPAGLSTDQRPQWLGQACAGRWDEVQGDIDYVAWTQEIAGALRQYAGAAVFSHFVALNAAVSVAEGTHKVIAFRPDHCSRSVFAIDGERLILVERGREAQSQVL